MKNKKITYGKNVYGLEEISAVNKRIRETTQMGRDVSSFEKKISKIFKKKFGLMVNSGSSALTLAIKILDFKDGGEIITPCLNFGTAISAILQNNLKPKLVDIKKETLQIDENLIEKYITKKTVGMLIPNLIGNVPNWPKIKKIAKKYNLKLIEDSADTIDAKIKNKTTSFYSDASITSFYGSHIISCAGNGGMLLVNEKKIYERAKILRSWGRLSSVYTSSEKISNRFNFKLDGKYYDNKFVFSEIGYNFEPSEIGASFGIEQLKKFKKFKKIRSINFGLHLKFFSNYKDLFITPKILKYAKTNYLSYPIIIKKNKYFNRNDLQKFLERQNIQTRPIFSGNILRHPAFKSLKQYNNILDFKMSDYIMEYGILIGIHHGLEKKDLAYVHDKITKFINIKK